MGTRTLPLTRRGFTFLEITITVLVITIILLTLVPGFFRSQQRAIGSQALANLDLIRNAQIMFQSENGTFTLDETLLNEYVDFALADNEWTYNVTAANGTSFTVRADRVDTRPFPTFWIELRVNAALAGTGANQTSSITYSSGTGYPP